MQLDLDSLYGLTGMLIIVCWGLLILHPDRASRWITVPKFAVPKFAVEYIRSGAPQLNG